MTAEPRIADSSFARRIALEPCPICGTRDNPIAIAEAGIERRFGMAVLPVENYTQASCRVCGLLYVNAPISSEYLVELYSREDVTWQTRYLGEEGRKTDVKSRNDDFNRIIDLAVQVRNLKGSRWLDFGCQTGELGALCRARFGAAMSGVEVSDDYASHADALWEGGGRSVRPSVTAFREEGRTFDVVSALETLEHLVRPWETVREFHEVMGPKGLLIVAVPSTHYFRLKYYLFKAFWRLFRRGPIPKRAENATASAFGLCHTHIYNFSPESLTRLIAMGGFTTIRVSGTGWSRKRWPFELCARFVSLVTGRRIQLFPSIVAIATRDDAVAR